MPGASSGKAGSGKSAGGMASNADLQDDEDTMNRFRGPFFREWARRKREQDKRQHGPLIVYDKSPAPPRRP
jgi:hypothetical protein